MDKPEVVIAFGGMAMVVLGLAQFIRDLLKVSFSAHSEQDAEIDKLRNEIHELEKKLDTANFNIQKYRAALTQARGVAKKYHLLYKGCIDGKTVSK